MEKLTICGAIIQALKQAGKPLTPNEIFDLIILSSSDKEIILFCISKMAVVISDNDSVNGLTKINSKV